MYSNTTPTTTLNNLTLDEAREYLTRTQEHGRLTEDNFDIEVNLDGNDSSAEIYLIMPTDSDYQWRTEFIDSIQASDEATIEEGVDCINSICGDIDFTEDFEELKAICLEYSDRPTG